jgi:uncharacterized repeat protein (TIGR01451 family)
MPRGLGSRAGEARRFLRGTASLCAFLLWGSQLSAQGTPAGSHIINWATLAYSSSGFAYVIPSDTVDLVVAQVAAVQLQPAQSTGAAPGASVVFAHSLTNQGNGVDSFSVAAVSAHAWTLTVYRDVNANGVLDAGDTVITAPVAAASGASVALLVQVAVPAVGSGGITDSITATATSRFNAGVSSSLRDVITVSNAALTFSLTKQVDRASASGGDILTYMLNYAVAGSDSASTVQLADTVPTGAAYVAGSIRWNGTTLTDAADGDAGRFIVLGNGVVAVSLGTINPGTSGSITFQARVNAVAPPPTVTNRGNAVFAWTGGTDTTVSNAVLTNILAPALSLTKQLTSPAFALVGQQVQYRLRYADAAGAGSAQSVVLTDTLPAGLQFVSATTAPTVAGQILSWPLGTLAGGDSGTIDVVLVVAASVRDTVLVRNVGYIEGQGTGATSATAPQVALVGPPTAALALDLSADVLEISVGEAIPYTTIVRNPGTLDVTNLQVSMQLPSGSRYVAGSAIGADSAVLATGRLILYSGAALAPGASRTLRFVAALVSPSGTVAETRAIATGQVTGGLAGSPEAIAWVQIRRAWPMETRAAIGKVWVDVNGDGVQQAVEPGITNVDVWTEDGMVATTDSSGKFSFVNVRPGRHAFRLDPRSVPNGYAVAGQDIQLVDASGWTTPRVDFRLVGNPLGGSPITLGAASKPMPAETRSAPGKPEAARTARHTLPFTFAAVRLRARRDSQPLFEHVLPKPHLAQVRYELTVQQPREYTLDAIVAFSPQADSAVVYVDGKPFTQYAWLGHWGIPIPVAHPDAQIRIVAWSSLPRNSAAVRIAAWPPYDGENATVRRYEERTETVVTAVVGDWLVPLIAMVPVPASIGGHLPTVALVPETAPAAVPVPPAPALDSAAGFLAQDETVRVARARPGPGALAAEQMNSIVQGQGVEIFSPGDGTVLASDHIYIGVKGEPNQSVVLYDGATRIDSARTRIDGELDFVAVPLAVGPHHLRVAMTNSWGHERWDSIAVHVTGLPSHFELSTSTLQLVADGRSSVILQMRVLDGWGVPVARPAYVTVSARGATPLGADADPTSVGLQLLSTAAGRLAVEVRPGRVIGPGALLLKSGDAIDSVALELLPEVRGLTVAGSGMVGAGASPDAYGALTARGSLDARTSFTVGVDSRRLNDGRNAFERTADPLAESQYPILGDASALQTRTASQTWLSARVERGYDWASFGDLSTSAFASGLSLAQYRRAVTGVAARVSTGPITWSAFGSLTSQALRQLQIRGAGISGPYQLASDIVPGTEQLRVETRDQLNPARAIVTQGLVRFVDYQIDYTNGVVLFKQPIPATDADGNPVFIVGTFESASAAEQRLVAGARATLDVRRLAGDGLRLDSLRLGFTAVSADQAVNSYRLVGSDVRLFRFGAVDLGAEVAYSERGDSAGLATAVKASYSLWGGRLTLGGDYMNIGREFTNPSNLALQPGLTQQNVRTGLRIGSTELRAEHSHEEFALQGIAREHTRMGIVQRVPGGLEVDGGIGNDYVAGASPTASTATSADVRAKWNLSPKLQLWAEARRHLSLTGPELTPDLLGAGASYRIASALTLEASERYVSRPDSQTQYSVSSIGLRADMGHGGQAWGSYQLTGGISGAGNAAVVGLRNRLQLAPSLAVNVMFERRQGVSRASIADPVRALPFLQNEGDYWSAGAGVELLPQGAPYRLTARGEYKDGSLQSTRLATVAGDVAFARSLALLTRQEFAQNALPGTPLARRMSSLWGLAWRPANTNRVNMLAKFQWLDERNPVGGGVLVARGAERRLIGAAEMIWSVTPRVELSTRYAVRRTEADRRYADGTLQSLTAWADYVGGRLNLDINRWISVRSDSRLLVERTTGTTAWDGAPALVIHPVPALEIATGYRFGDLNDPDFSVRGGHGVFLTLSAVLTEKLNPTAASFWRSRF